MRAHGVRSDDLSETMWAWKLVAIEDATKLSEQDFIGSNPSQMESAFCISSDLILFVFNLSQIEINQSISLQTMR